MRLPTGPRVVLPIDLLLLCVGFPGASDQLRGEPRLLRPSGDRRLVLSVPLHGQIGSYWCYAACAQMVVDYFGPEPTQCSIVDYYRSVVRGMPAPAACGSPPGCCPYCSTCDKAGGYASAGLIRAGYPPAAGKVLGFSELENQMLLPTKPDGVVKGAPVITTWYWRVRTPDGGTTLDGSSHNVVVRGTVVHNGGSYVAVHDPLPVGFGTYRGAQSLKITPSGGGDLWVFPYATFHSANDRTRSPGKWSPADLYDINKL